jgi:hypothetical protein
MGHLNLFIKMFFFLLNILPGDNGAASIERGADFFADKDAFLRAVPESELKMEFINE